MEVALGFGRYNAICFSGMLSFEDCLKVVRVRADAMQEDSGKGTGGTWRNAAIVFEETSPFL